jgi:osmoprotectant transport system permease protein
MNQFLQANGWEIARLTFEHLWLTLSAMLLAAGIGLPLGILLTRRERLAKPVIAVANIIQTIPSLALFGLLLPVPWLGENAAPSPATPCCPSCATPTPAFAASIPLWRTSPAPSA